jgi:hypothetical protein
MKTGSSLGMAGSACEKMHRLTAAWILKTIASSVANVYYMRRHTTAALKGGFMGEVLYCGAASMVS